MSTTPLDEDGLTARARAFLGEHDPVTTARPDFLRARFDAGVAWVHYAEGLGGLGADPALQRAVDAVFAEVGSSDNQPHRNVIRLGMAAPTILRFGTPRQQQRRLGPLWTGEESWCQVFSEPGACSDLARVATSAKRDGGARIVNGQKVWTSRAHEATRAVLVTRTDPAQPKHRGLTFFVCDMRAPGVDVWPLREITGESEFNEVYLDECASPTSSGSVRSARAGQAPRTLARLPRRHPGTT